MADNVKDVELRIRAKDYSQKTLNELVKSIEELVSAQNQQQKAAEKGEASSKKLATTYKQLEQAQQALIRQVAMVDRFKQQSTAMDTAATKTEELQRAFGALAMATQALDNPTKKQINDLARLEKQLAAATASEARAENAYRATGSALKALGVDTNNLTAAEQRITAASTAVSTSMKNQEQAILGLGAAQQRAAAASAAAAEADRIRAQQAQAQASTYRSFWVTALNAKEEAESRAANNKALQQADEQIIQSLRRAADQADLTARGYRTMASTITTVVPQVNSLGNAINGILSPTQSAASTLGGLRGMVTSLAIEVSKINGPVTDLKDKLQTLDAVQKSATGIAKSIDSYTRQVEVLRNARAEYVAARADVSALSNQLRQSTAPSDQLNASLATAQARLRAAAKGMQDTTAATRQMRESVRSAGVDTRNLEGEAGRLTAAMRQTQSTANQLKTAVDKFGTSAEAAGKKLNIFSNGARQSLSYAQRLRGEVLAMTTAFVGVQAGINLANGALDAYRSKMAINTRLAVLVGNDTKAITAEWNYLQTQADRLGIGFESLAMSYSKFGIAAKATGLSMQETRFIFEGFAEAARASKMSTDDFNGTMTAVEQMLSKGTIQAEELRGQLGDRLPGAFQLAAQAAGLSVQEFTKAMENGQISSDFVVNIARQLRSVYKDILPSAVDTMIAAEGRLQTAYYNFRLSIAESGLVDAYQEFISKMTTLLRSDQGAAGAKALSQVFSGLIEVMSYVLDHTDQLKIALIAIGSAQVLSGIAGLIMSIKNIGLAIASLALMTKTATLALVNYRATLAAVMASSFITWIRGAGAALTAATAAATGLSVATAAIVWPIALATAFAGAVWYLTNAFKAGKQEALDYANALDVSADALRKMSTAQRTLALDKLNDAADTGRGKLKDLTSEVYDLDKSLKNLQQRDNGSIGMKSSIDALQRKYNERRAELDTVEQDLRKTEQKQKALQDAQKGQFNENRPTATADPGTGGSSRNILIGAAQKQLEKDQKAAQKKLHNSQLKDAKADLQERLDLVRSEYDERLKIADNIGGEEGKKLRAGYEAVIKDRLAAETAAYNRSQEASNKSEVAKGERRVELARQVNEQISAIEDDLANRNAKVDSNTSYADRRAAAIQNVGNAYDSLYTKVNKLGGAEGSAAKARLDELVKQRQEIEGQKQDEDELARLQGIVNDRMQTRAALLDAISKKREAGLITGTDANAESAKVLADSAPGIMQAATATQQFAATLKTLTPDQLIQIQAAMDGIKASTQATTFEYQKLVDVGVNSFVSNGVEAFATLNEHLAGFVSGAESGGEALRGMLDASRQFFASFLMDIAKAIIKQQLLNLLQTVGKSVGGVWGTALSASAAAVNHSGGTVGSGSGRSRAVSSSWFAGAPKFHDGGLPGLKANEVPTILERGEEVLTRKDPRNILNGGMSGGSGESGPTTPQSIRVINTIDSGSVVSAGLATPEGEKAIYNYMKANKSDLKTLLT